MRKFSVYIYPNISRELMGSNNPYIGHLKKALDQNDLTVDHAVSENAFANFIRKGIFSDMVILNWLENLPARRMGILQTLVIMPYLLLLKIKGVKIVWIKHNKVSHTQEWFAVSKMIQSMLSRFADKIIVHAADAGITDPEKTILFSHPSNVGPEDILPPNTTAIPDIDLLIWGSLLPYKGVAEFLHFVKTDPALAGLNIHIAGKAGDEYYSELEKESSPRVTLINKFVKQDELHDLFNRSRFILFTYKKDSIISSGILLDSLVACKKIIAPDCGAFRDMALQQQFVSTFDNFSDIASIYEANYDDFHLDEREVRKFVAQNSWYNMGNLIKGLLGPKTHVQSPNHIEIPQTP